MGLSSSDGTKWTWSGWLKRGKLSLNNSELIQAYSGIDSAGIRFITNDQIQIYSYSNAGSSYYWQMITSQVFRDTSSWYHIMVSVDTTQGLPENRLKLYVNGQQVTAFDTNSPPSVSSGSTMNNYNTNHYIGGGSSNFDGYLADVYLIDGQALNPGSFGLFRSNGIWGPISYTGTYGNNGFYLPFTNNTSSETIGYDYSSTNPELVSNGTFFSDITGWSVSSSGTAPAITWQSNHTARVSNSSASLTYGYIPITTVIGQTYYAQTYVRAASIGGTAAVVSLGKADNTGNTTNAVTISSTTQAGVTAGSGYLTGTFTATATTTYIILYAGIIGTNTTGADFAQVSVALGGYKKNWQAFSIGITGVTTTNRDYDSMTDVPVPVNSTTANFCTMNYNGSRFNTSDVVPTFTLGSLQVQNNASGGTSNVVGTLGATSGKYYFEVYPTYIATVGNMVIGLNQASCFYGINFGLRDNGTTNGMTILTGSTFSYVSNDVIGIAFDVDTRTAILYKNGVQQFTCFITSVPDTNTEITAWAQMNGADELIHWNFGQRPFRYTPPTGYNRLNSYNIANTPIMNGSAYFASTNYVGDDTSSRSITNPVNGISFRPDLVFIKDRTVANYAIIQDSVRGTGTTKVLSPAASSNEGEATFIAPRGAVSSFNLNGFTVANGSVNGTNINKASDNIIAWQWKAGAGVTATNTTGSIQSTVSANPISGFSIVSYTASSSGGTVGHGLSKAPDFMLIKDLDSGSNWFVYHTNLGNTKYMQLNTAEPEAISGGVWGNTSPTSSTFTIGNAFLSYRQIAYCWSTVLGYSKFSSYAGNDSTGPFVYCGFRPRWIMIKNKTVGSSNWSIYDTTRNPYNPATLRYSTVNSTTQTDVTAGLVDILSNGFKIRSGTGITDLNVNNYVYAAFAENPFKYALAR
jgi:hypothetical protein